MLTDVKL